MNIIDAKLVFNGTLNMTNSIENIIVHHALAKSCTIQDIHSWHLQNGWAGCGYHYFINKKGEIYRGRPDKAVGAHCSESNMNYHSLGICLEGCYEDYKTPSGVDWTEKTVPQVQLDALVELVKYLMNLYKIPDTKVDPHRKYATYKKCPGNYFPWDAFKASIVLKDYKALYESMLTEHATLEQLYKDADTKFKALVADLKIIQEKINAMINM